MNTKLESTYALLVRSQEESRSVLEMLLYLILTLSVFAEIFQFAQTPLKFSAPRLDPPCTDGRFAKYLDQHLDS